jgi:protein-tyrosine phosphatase
MRQISPHLLWLGHAGDGRDAKRILDAGIEAVVQLAADEPVLALPREVIYCRFPLVDAAGNDGKLLDLAVSTLASLIAAKRPTLVCCSAGLSRSPAIAAAALAKALDMEPDACLRTIAELAPTDVQPALWQEIKDRSR